MADTVTLAYSEAGQGTPVMLYFTRSILAHFRTSGISE